jgi:hypothetical protein
MDKDRYQTGKKSARKSLKKQILSLKNLMVIGITASPLNNNLLCYFYANPIHLQKSNAVR